MEKDKYPFEKTQDITVYDFYSIGHRGTIRKKIRFDLMQRSPSIFNLTLGNIPDEEDQDEIDTMTVTGNGDTAKILTVVSDVIIDFLLGRTEALVYVEGATPARNRLFQMWIARTYKEIRHRIWIEGLVKKRWIPFKKGITFEAFLIRKK
jgi:hypothetical protein